MVKKISKLNKLMLTGCAFVAFVGVNSVAFAESAAKSPVAKQSAVKETPKKETSAKESPKKDSETKDLTKGSAPLTVNFSGSANIYSGMSFQQVEDNGKKDGRPHFSVGDAELVATVAVQPSNKNFKVKYVVSLETIHASSLFIKKHYFEFAGKFGTLQFGNTKGVENVMQQHGTYLSGGAGGLFGALPGMFNYAAGTISGVDPVGYTNRSTKLNFISPKVYGFQLGLSYTPKVSHVGRDAQNVDRPGSATSHGNESGIYPDKKNMPYGTNNFSVALSHSDSIDEFSWNVGASYTFEKSKLKLKDVTETTDLRNTNVYQIWGQLSYSGWTLGVGMIDNGVSRLPKVALPVVTGRDFGYLGDFYKGDAGRSYNIGLSWKNSDWKVAFVYLHSNRKTDDVNKAINNNYVLTVDRKIADGVKLFTELAYINSHSAGIDIASSDYTVGGEVKPNNKNQGAVVLTGVSISF